MSDDLHAIERVLDGDVEAFRVLVERYQATLFRAIRRFLPTLADCEDIAQETFLAAFVHLGAYDPARASFSTWLLTIARNKCRNALKRKRPIAMAAPPEPADCRGPDAAMARQEAFRELDAALAALPFEQRTAFVLAELEGLSYEEIARIEGVRLGTVKSRVGRARQKLRARLRAPEE